MAHYFIADSRLEQYFEIVGDGDDLPDGWDFRCIDGPYPWYVTTSDTRPDLEERIAEIAERKPPGYY
jgi:hypothetical protein